MSAAFTPGTPGFLLLCLGLLALMVNGWTFFVFGLDQRRAASGGFRVPQRTLLSLALLGGWPGAILAQVWSGRKTGRQPIGTLLTLTGVAQVLMAGAVGVTAMSDGVHPLLDINRLAAAFDGTAPPGAEKALPRRFGPGSADW